MAVRTARPKSSHGARQAGAGRSATRGKQVNVVFSEETRRWLEQRAGSKRGVAGYLRAVVERERQAEREAELLAMFNRAAEDLTEADREERRLFMRAHPNRD
jgi:hypothetical protein